ncbi:unnamed protein product [Closterium sp. NIES-65]|nr:unnamed protein product [Closterium sp. NIES-65]
MVPTFLARIKYVTMLEPILLRCDSIVSSTTSVLLEQPPPSSHVFLEPSVYIVSSWLALFSPSASRSSSLQFWLSPASRALKASELLQMMRTNSWLECARQMTCLPVSRHALQSGVQAESAGLLLTLPRENAEEHGQVQGRPSRADSAVRRQASTDRVSSGRRSKQA